MDLYDFVNSSDGLRDEALPDPNGPDKPPMPAHEVVFCALENLKENWTPAHCMGPGPAQLTLVAVWRLAQQPETLRHIPGVLDAMSTAAPHYEAKQISRAAFQVLPFVIAAHELGHNYEHARAAFVADFFSHVPPDCEPTGYVGREFDTAIDGLKAIGVWPWEA